MVNQIKTRCCVVGGGPAGIMLGFLLARAGIQVLVLEKHADFFRDFRGDTIHPSTMELLHELGLLEEFLRLPHQELPRLKLSFDGNIVDGPDCSHLPVRCKFVALMPQWDFLNFLSAHAKKFLSFSLKMKHEVTGLILENDRVVGARVNTDDGPLEIRADFVFGTDGRHSVVRQSAGLELQDFGVPIDVLWFRLPKPNSATDFLLGRIRNGQMLVTIDRGDYFQIAFVIPKGGFEKIQRDGLENFRKTIVAIVPEFHDAINELDDWNKIKLLTVQINRLRQWHRAGLLCIGDAAHAMSPAGGVGINLAIQDAVATANLLAGKILRDECSTDDLALVQRRREFPVRMTQRIQVFIHRRMFGKNSSKAISLSWPARTILSLLAPLLRRLGARIVGIGFRPEHIEDGMKTNATAD
ncbi:MAG TPA: FAD-dependent oxidoreductase [Verrucomicrobiae bacterium]|jgi:2-polyprenyl-6-methoxyphenol hydroxylase-like FAD-dependent oxidoreductase